MKIQTVDGRIQTKDGGYIVIKSTAPRSIVNWIYFLISHHGYTAAKFKRAEEDKTEISQYIEEIVINQ